jgi:hypothetical protein
MLEELEELEVLRIVSERLEAAQLPLAEIAQ